MSDICSKNHDLAERLLSRFLRYAKTYSESSSEKADSGIMPSTPQQKEMASLLNAELCGLGLKNVTTTADCYTYAFLEASAGREKDEPFCLIAHIDTSEETSGKNVQPVVHKNYDGSVIQLKNSVVHDPASDKELAAAAKQRETIITSDGTTLLGADDKAGVAEIVTAVEYLVKNPQIPHGAIEILFSPDEETGHGMDRVPLELLKSKYAYTVDGGTIGELETECFNAYKSTVSFTGKPKHTGTARPDMVNAVTMACTFLSYLPKNEVPEATDGRQGFYAPMSIEGSMEDAKVVLFLRDFSQEGMEERKRTVEMAASLVERSCGGHVSVEHTLQYKNMHDVMQKNPAVVERLVKAYRNCGMEPVFPPIRGGTDGSRLSEMGIPTPNIFTGGHNFHSRYEWASLEQMVKATEVLVELASNK